MRKLTSIEQQGVSDIIEIYDKYMNAHSLSAFVPTSLFLYKSYIAKKVIDDCSSLDPSGVLNRYIDEARNYAITNRFNQDFLCRVFLLDLLEDNGFMYFDKKMPSGVYEYCLNDQAKMSKYTPFVNMPTNAALRILRHIHSNAIVNIELLKDLQKNGYKSNEELTLDEAKAQVYYARNGMIASFISVCLAIIALIVSIISGNRPQSFEKSQYDSLLNNKFEICFDKEQFDSLLSNSYTTSIDSTQHDAFHEYQLNENERAKAKKINITNENEYVKK